MIVKKKHMNAHVVFYYKKPMQQIIQHLENMEKWKIEKFWKMENENFGKVEN